MSMTGNLTARWQDGSITHHEPSPPSTEQTSLQPEQREALKGALESLTTADAAMVEHVSNSSSFLETLHTANSTSSTPGFPGQGDVGHRTYAGYTRGYETQLKALLAADAPQLDLGLLNRLDEGEDIQLEDLRSLAKAVAQYGQSGVTEMNTTVELMDGLHTVLGQLKDGGYPIHRSLPMSGLERQTSYHLGIEKSLSNTFGVNVEKALNVLDQALGNQTT